MFPGGTRRRSYLKYGADVPEGKIFTDQRRRTLTRSNRSMSVPALGVKVRRGGYVMYIHCAPSILRAWRPRGIVGALKH